MSHRYRVAFRETLCGKKKGHYHNNGFSREAQSSIRETIVSGYENSHLVSLQITYLYYTHNNVIVVNDNITR